MRKHSLRLIHTACPEKKRPVLKAESVCKHFSNQPEKGPVLHNIHFEIQNGEFVCILGPSGCGKSTLLNMVGGFAPPTQGHIFFNGEKINGPSTDRCIIFQEDALFPWLTVSENIAFGIQGKKKHKKLKHDVRFYVEQVGLQSFENYLPKDLSGGMKQRVSLARVIILQPKLLLMDEPFGALDAQTREDMQHLLLTLWKKMNQTILFVTHDIAEAVLLADRILIMDRNPGRIKMNFTISLSRPRNLEDPAFHQVYRDLRKRITKTAPLPDDI